MKKFTSVTLVLALTLSLAACGGGAQSVDSQSPSPEISSIEQPSNVNISWFEIGEGPSGWVVAVHVENHTSASLNLMLDVTVNDAKGNILGNDIVEVKNLAANDYMNYPVHCEISDSYNVTWEEITSIDEQPGVSDNSKDDHVVPDIKTTDNRGIPGMDTFAIRAVLEGSPFGIPITEDVPAPVEATEIYAVSCTSTGPDSGNVSYDYSITMDSDGEIIGASFGITSITASESEMLNAADLFFYAISLISYDTSDEDALTSWFEENLPNANTDGTSITIGDAVYTLYGNSGLLYFVDISKTA